MKEQHPSVWRPNADGSFTSTISGKTARHPELVAKIRRRRIAADLPIVPVDGIFDLSGGGLAQRINTAAGQQDVSPHEWLARAVEAALGAEAANREAA